MCFFCLFKWSEKVSVLLQDYTVNKCLGLNCVLPHKGLSSSRSNTQCKVRSQHFLKALIHDLPSPLCILKLWSVVNLISAVIMTTMKHNTACTEFNANHWNFELNVSMGELCSPYTALSLEISIERGKLMWFEILCGQIYTILHKKKFAEAFSLNGGVCQTSTPM